MPARGDHDARRRDLSAAVWRVLAVYGFGGLTMRRVAAELEGSTGLLTHYFGTKRDLLRYALDVAEQHTVDRIERPAGEPGLAALRQAVLSVLPLSEETTVLSRVWVSSWDAAFGDPDLTEYQIQRYRRWRDRLSTHVAAAQQRGELPPGDPDDTAALAASFAHGLVVQVLFDPDRFPPERQAALVDQFLYGQR